MLELFWQFNLDLQSRFRLTPHSTNLWLKKGPYRRRCYHWYQLKLSRPLNRRVVPHAPRDIKRSLLSVVVRHLTVDIPIRNQLHWFWYTVGLTDLSHRVHHVAEEGFQRLVGLSVRQRYLAHVGLDVNVRDLRFIGLNLRLLCLLLFFLLRLGVVLRVKQLLVLHLGERLCDLVFAGHLPLRLLIHYDLRLLIFALFVRINQILLQFWPRLHFCCHLLHFCWLCYHFRFLRKRRHIMVFIRQEPIQMSASPLQLGSEQYPRHDSFV